MISLPHPIQTTYFNLLFIPISHVWVLFICLLIGVLDEFSQSFMLGRTSSVRDVIIDFSGASFFFIVKGITNLFDKVVKYIIGIMFKSKNTKDKQF